MEILTERWYCDSCDEVIETVDDGWVEWIGEKDSTLWTQYKEIRLVHARKACQFDEKKHGEPVHDLPLEMFLGPDGLSRLLHFLEHWYVPSIQLIEFIRRLHVPGYEEARRDFPEALRRTIITEGDFVSQSEIRMILDDYNPLLDP